MAGRPLEGSAFREFKVRTGKRKSTQMKKLLTVLVAVTALLGLYAMAAYACPGDAMADGKSACPYHTENSYAKKLAVGDKFKCANCGMDGTVAADTPMVEHEGKYYYFMSDSCKKEFEKKVDEFYKGKAKK
jgi:YHS domain-containing protein